MLGETGLETVGESSNGGVGAARTFLVTLEDDKWLVGVGLEAPEADPLMLACARAADVDGVMDELETDEGL